MGPKGYAGGMPTVGSSGFETWSLCEKDQPRRFCSLHVVNCA